MKNKGLIVVLTTVVTLLCLYYLSFTFVSRQVQQDAAEYATLPDGSVSYAKKQSYLDSVWHEPVYSFLGLLDYTYKEVKDNELSLGLDLQGGMNVTLEVSPVEVIKGMAGNVEDQSVEAAIKYARERQRDSQENFVDLFYEGWQQNAGGRRLADVFATAANRNVISINASDQEVLRVIREQVESAIERSFQILRTRVDRFGTSQPNIQRLQGTGRILVELPGVDNPERVRKLLQGTAKLEFLEVVEIQEYYQALAAINSLLVEESRNNAATAGAAATTQPATADTATATDAQAATADTTASDDLASQLAAADTTAAADSLNLQVSPLFSLTRSQGGLVYSVRDTAQINRILRRPDVQELIPSNLSFVWDVKAFTPENTNEQLLNLYAIQRERGGRAPLTGEVIERARQDIDDRGRPDVVMVMNSDGARTWKRLTANNIQQRIAIVLDNYVYSAPVVQNEIPGGVSSISGNFTVDEAKDLANILEAGALPAPAKIVEEAIVGPSLGEKARNQGILSVVAGLGLVVIFIVAYYSKGGLVANLALLFNIFFIFGILAQLDAALTLPGIAGIVLTIGMSIDANVLIFERIREELSSGLSLKAAINKGYQKAYSSIIDANVTTLLVAVVLYVLGQGPVKGFAITLIVGILCSLFTAVLITRVVIDWMTSKGDASKVSFDTALSRNLFKGGEINFMGNRRVAYTISGIVIALGIVALGVNNGLNMGVDFTGGRTYVVAFDEKVAPTDLKVALTDDFAGAGTEVKTYGADNVLKVTTSYMIDVDLEDADDDVKAALVRGVSEATGKAYVEDGSAVSQGQFSIISSSKVGATIADDIKDASWQAGLFSLLIMFLYILVRFSGWQFSAGAIIALVHDVAITLGAFAIAGALGMSYEVDQVFVAAILTVIGYSINDTVVVFDRIREEVGNRYNKATMLNTFNSAINSTLNRTMMTSLTTLVVVLVLFLFGGEVLRGFSFALLVGILVGTYSSVFIASPIAADLLSRSKEDTVEPAKPATARQKA